jgi:peptidoglycan/LPS O-acetylase OafA/YrhL
VIHTIFPTIEAAAIAVTLLVLVAGRQGVIFKVVNLRAAQHVGKLSFSLYIWQQLFLVPSVGTSAPAFMLHSNVLYRWPLLYLAAFCSFNFLERPLIKLRSQFRHGVSV